MVDGQNSSIADNWLVHRVVVTDLTLDRAVERLSFYTRTVINGS